MTIWPDVLVGGWAEDFADFAGETLQGEGLLQESFLIFGGERCGEGIFGVAGEIENLGVGPRGQELLDEFVATEAGHDDVGDDEMDCVGMAGGEGECGIAVGGFENAIAAGLKSFTN